MDIQNLAQINMQLFFVGMFVFFCLPIGLILGLGFLFKHSSYQEAEEIVDEWLEETQVIDMKEILKNE